MVVEVDVDEREDVCFKINEVLDNNLGIENSDIIKELSTFNISDHERVKRTFKNEVEKKEIHVNISLIESLRKVKSDLDKICGNISFLNSSVIHMSNRISDTKAKTQHLIEETSKLRHKENNVEKKTKLITAILNRYKITPEQLNVLHGTTKNEPITLEFFELMGDLDVLYEECKVLFKSGFDKPAMELMDKINLHREGAIDRLYRWTQSACRNVDQTNNLLLPRAMKTLQKRQILFSNVLDEFCTLRKSVVVTTFIDALTKGRENNKPIEFYVNEPKRYIGDILAVVYFIIPIEKEHLNLLLKDCEDIDKDAEIVNALTIILEALCPILKVRADLILSPDKDPITLCSIVKLTTKYRSKIKEIFSSGVLIQSSDELYTKSEEAFLISLDSKIQKELSYGVKAPPADLTPSQVVTDLISFYREVISILLSDSDLESQGLIKIVTSHILDPLLHAINVTACHLSSTDMSVYLLNCMYHIQCTLTMYQNMDERNERLQAQSEAQIDTLTSEQVSSLVANLNMGPIYTILQEKAQGPLSVVPGMDTLTLKSFLYKFENFVAMPNVYLLPQLGLLISHLHKKNVQRRSFDVIIAIYKSLYDAVFEPSNQYNEPESIMRRTPEDITNLLRT